MIKSYLRFIDAYYSPVSNKNIIDWYTDQAYHGDKKPEKYVTRSFLSQNIYLPY